MDSIGLTQQLYGLRQEIWEALIKSWEDDDDWFCLKSCQLWTEECKMKCSLKALFLKCN